MSSAVAQRAGLVLACVLAMAPPMPAADAPAAKAPANLFANPGFEDGRGEWRLDQARGTTAKFTVEKGDAAAGEYSARVAIESVADWGTQFGQSFDAGAKGKTYTFAAVARAVKDPVTVRLEIERPAAPYDRAAASEKVALKKDAWTEIHVTFKIEKDFREGWFAYISCAQAPAEYRLDMVRLYEGEYVPYTKAAREEAAAVGAGLYDTGAASAAPLSGEALAARTGWTQVPEDQTTHAFKGDAVMLNGRLAVVVRRGAAGAEVYAAGPKGFQRRAALVPLAAGADGRIESVAIARNGAGATALDVALKTAGGQRVGLRYQLDAGQVFVRTETRGEATALRIEAPCRFAVLPDFFADDIVIDAADLAVAKAELPSENFLLHLVGDGEAVVMAVAADRGDDFRVAIAGQGADRRLTSSEVPYGKSAKTWVAVIEGPGVWHRRDIAREETGQIVRLDWQMPWPAQWRFDWRKADRLTDSWEMLLARRSGDFEKPGMFGDPSTLPANRKRWTTVLGSFAYPCWVDQDGRGSVQPLKSDVVRFQGPALLYPIGRVKATPLDIFTVTDIARATLGVGPCEYILDLEGQGSQYKGRATCAARDALRPIYQAREQKAKRAEIEKILQEVMVFIRHIRGRVEQYVRFGHETLAYLEQQKRAHPELAPFAAEMAPACKATDGYVEKRRKVIKTPDEAQAMVDEWRRTMIDYEGADAFEKCKTFTAALVEIGGNQDELVGECRMAVRIVRQRAALAAAADPKAGEAAREIRRRAQEVLRNPAGHEGARH